MFRFVLLLRGNLWRVIVTGLAFAGLLGVYAFLVQPQFAATATVIIPRSNPSAAGLALQAAAGGLDLLGGGNEIYLDILHSHTVGARMVERFGLVQDYHAKDINAAITILTGKSKMEVSLEGLLTITVTDSDPKKAAALANAFFQELDAENHKIAITSAGQQRIYFQAELAKENDALADAEIALQKAQQKSGAIDTGTSLLASVGATESVRAQLRARQIELNGLLQSETNQNPQVKTLQSQIGALAGQLHQLEITGGSVSGIPASQLPATALSLTRASRDVKFHESLYAILERQLEVVKQQESKDFSQLEMLDAAEPPTHKSWPPRALYILVGFFLGAGLALIYAVLKSFFGTVMQNPENRARYQALLRNRTAGQVQ